MEQLSNHYVSYQEFKQTLDSEMTRVAAGFVRIGFLLNYAEETCIISEGGYGSVNDFAKVEYNLEETQVSRFINIYKRFGVPGEPRLQDQYINHGVAKLGIMLTLPDFLNQEITEGYSKREINTLKHEYEAEQQVTDIEVAIEQAEMKESVQYTLPGTFTKAVYQLIHDEPQLYLRIYDCIELDGVKEILAPVGENSYIVRIKGIGRITFFLKTEDVSIVNLRDGNREEYSWQQLYDAFKEYFGRGTDARDSWCNVFQEPWPLEEKKQGEKPVENPVKSHNDKVVKPKKESRVKVVEPKNVTKTEKTVSNSEEQLPGQDSILNHPELLPDDMKGQEVLTGEVEDIENPANTDNDNVQQVQEGMKVEHFAPVQNNDKANTIRGYKAGIKASLAIMEDKYEQGDWNSVYINASNIAFRAKKIMELESKN